MNTSTIILMAQGALMGYVSGEAFGGVSNPLFWATLIANSFAMVYFGIARRNED